MDVGGFEESGQKNDLLICQRVQERNIEVGREAEEGRKAAEKKLDIVLMHLNLTNRRYQTPIF